MALANMITEISYAPKAFGLLRGCLCLYKPSMKGFKKTREALLTNLVNDLNSMECRPMRERIEIVGDVSLDTNTDQKLEVVVKQNLADHPLVSGPRYDTRHIPLSFVNYPGWYSSGLMIGFIGPASSSNVRRFLSYKQPKTYEIKGRFGFASKNFRDDDKIIAKCSYKHLTVDRFYHILAKLESIQRHLTFKVLGVDEGSEEAYLMALKGFTPPQTGNKICPFVYSIKPLTFEPPDFSFRLECLNDNEIFLAEMAHRIGLAMQSLAICTGIRLIKYGPFTIEEALLQKHWNLENVLEHIHASNQLLDSFKTKMHKLAEEESI